MLLRLYKIRTYAQLDTWSRGTKQSQTKPILPDLPLPARHKTVLTSYLHKKYEAATTQAADKLTRHISTNQGATPYHPFGTKGYDTASDAAEPPCTNAGCRLLNGSATIRTSPASSAALVPRLCRLNSNSDKTAVQNHRPHDKSTYNRDAHPGCFFNAAIILQKAADYIYCAVLGPNVGSLFGAAI